MRILVTGASGFIGSRVVRRAIEAGHEVRAFVRATSRTDRIQGLPWQPAVGDIRDAAAVTAAVAGCDAVIHLAAVVAWERIDSPETAEVIERGTAHVLQAAAAIRAAGGQPPRIVLVSSVAAMGGTPSPAVLDESSPLAPLPPDLGYAIAKRRAEALADEAAGAGLPVVIVRPGEVYGPDDRDHVTCGTLIDFARSWPVVICRGGVSIVHADDVADGILRVFAAARPPGTRYLLAGESLSLRQLASLSIELLGRRAPVVTVPRPLLRAATRAAARLRIPVPWNAKAVPYATRFWFVDARRSAGQLGMSFRSARDTLAPTLAWLVATGRARQPRRRRRAQLGASGGPLNTGSAG